MDFVKRVTTHGTPDLVWPGERIAVFDHQTNLAQLKLVDSFASKVEWIVSVSMLSEGWDVKNVFQIVPHEERAFNSSLGSWSYEVVDTKLAKETRGGTISSWGSATTRFSPSRAVIPRVPGAYLP